MAMLVFQFRQGTLDVMRSEPSSTARNLRARVVHVVTSDRAVTLMRGQLQFLQQHGFDVTLICSPGDWLEVLGRTQNVQIIELPITRQIAPLKDLVSFWRLWRTMRVLRPAVTNVGTPKAGLLGGCAAWLTGVPCRFYTLRGLRFETLSGLRRQLVVFADRLACRFAHRIICVSQSLREQAIALKLASPERTVVFGSGSSNGVDASLFALTPERTKRAGELRSELGLPAQAPVLGFVGRLTRDKGISELVESFLRLSDRFPDLRLLLLGASEQEDRLDDRTREHLETHPHIILAGEVLDTAPYYALMDVLVLPSHREGFPNVVLEAYAAGKPVVAARATGILDAVVDGETGLLFPVGEVAALTRALEILLSDKARARELGCAGQELVKREFRQEVIWDALNEEYRRLLQMRGASLHVRESTDLVAANDE
jgi:glycosyltransferase involved in cell wall biosynthesis